MGFFDGEQHIAADYQAREAPLGRARARDGVDLLATPQHRDPIGYLEHLAELMADEHDRGTILFEAVEHAHELPDLLRGQDGRRLVEHEDPRVPVQRLENLDPLLGTDGDVLDRGVGIDCQSVAVG